MVPETDSRVNGRTMGGSLVTGNFFHRLTKTRASALGAFAD